LDPSAVLADQARIDKNKRFSQVQKFFFDSPVQVQDPITSFLDVPKTRKSPDRKSIRGFPFCPQDLWQASVREGSSPFFRQVF
jgi:hypothetical protein